VIGDVIREREATVDVDRGLFLLRYASGAVSGPSPIALVRPAAGSEPFVEILSAPGVVNGFVSAPGECVVIRAEKPARINLQIKGQGTDGSLDATFRIEPLAGIGSSSASPPATRVDDASGRGSAFKLVAHVARRGDIAVDPGVWIAGPEAPAAIEGVGVHGALPAGVGIEIQPLVGTNPPRWLDWAPSGAFVGTRGRALPLVGLRLRLVGERTGQHELSADALFLGSPIVSKRGPEVELQGPVGRDPLVGLRLALAAVAAGAKEQDFAGHGPVLAETEIVDRQKEPRIRLFRASAGGPNSPGA